MRVGLSALLLFTTVGADEAYADGDELRGRFIHIGPASTHAQPENESVLLGGSPFPGAGVETDAQWTGAVEFGQFITPNVALSLTLVAPAQNANIGTGSLAAFGNVGDDTFGQVMLTGHYHFNRDGRFQPYIGGGIGYFFVTDTTDGSLTSLEVDNDWGPVLQAGADVMFTERFGAFIDVKRLYVRTTARALFGVTPVEANTDLDPLTVHTGISLRF